MTTPFLIAFLPELVLLGGALALFVVSLGTDNLRAARTTLWITVAAALGACWLALDAQGVLFDGAYRVDAFSQLLKLALIAGLGLLAGVSRDLPDVREDIKAEYFLLLTLSVLGLVMLVSCIEIITLVIALELSSFPLYLLVAMRREREGQRVQMESALKYLMFGIAANGVMLFGLSHLFGATGTMSLPVMLQRLETAGSSPLVVAGLALTLAGLFYKLAVFPFHFWTPDVYQGASNETTSLIASLPKVGAVAVLARFVSLASPQQTTLVWLLAGLATASMCYGNLAALVQRDFKRLLGFSAIAHAGYALIGFVTLDAAGYTAALFYILAYVLMVLACFVVIGAVSRDGVNVGIADLAGLSRRSPLLAATLLVGVFALAGIPPFAGFIGKFSLLKAALAKGHLWLVIVAVLNSAVAIYYYLGVVREAYFKEATDAPPIRVSTSTAVLCAVLMVGIVVLGVVPGAVLQSIASAVALLGGNALVAVSP